MNDYTIELTKLQKDLTEIVETVQYMCSQSMKKSNKLLETLKNMDLSTVENVNSSIKDFLDKININLTDFKEKFQLATDSYKHAVENNNSPKKKFSLTLRKTGETPETDIDLTNSDVDECESSSINYKVQQDEKDLQRHADVNKDTILQDEDEKVCETGKISDNDSDSQANIPIVPVPSSNSSNKESEGMNELHSNIQEVKRDIQQVEDNASESTSFDFDDDDCFNANLETTSINSLETPSEAIRQAHKSNHELLEMLTKAVTDSSHEPSPTTIQQCEEAITILEEECTNFSLTDSDTSDSDVYSLVSCEGSDIEWESKNSEILMCDDDEPKHRELSIELTRVDEFSDDAIDRLCNLHNLNKRKCRRQLRPQRGLKVKRQRRLSTASSESSDLSTSGSTTPDLNLNEMEEGLPLSPCPPNKTDLADALYNDLDTSNEESSDSETDIDADKEEKKEKKENKMEKGKIENVKGEEEKRKKRKRRRSLDSLRGPLWSASSESEEEEKPKPIFTGLAKIVDEDPVTISDSMSDSDSDVTIIKEGDDEGSDDEEGKTKGRRNIRSIIPDSELNILTQKAKTEEDERIQRLEEHSQMLESVLSQHDEFVLDFDLRTSKPLITVDKNLTRKLKPHQKHGVQFMWQACYESVEMLKKPNSGTGCILAHCMGLGKTLQVITLIHTLLTHEVTNTKHILVVCPLSTVSNWQNEFKMAFNLLEEPSTINLYFLIQQEAVDKCTMVKEWRQKGGVIVMGYQTFQRLSEGKARICEQEETKRVLYEALIDPGADLVVCDEGHMLKNGETQRNKSLTKVRTKRRIALTGTPLQNNLTEYYYMVDFVKTHLLGTYKEYQNRFARPIMNGQYHDSRPEDVKIMKKRTHVLTKLLKKTIHRVETRVLQSYLPEIMDYTIFVKLEPIQVDLYKKYIELAKLHIGQNMKQAGFFQDFRMSKYITLHPHTIRLYYNRMKNIKKGKKKLKEIINVEDELEETSPPKISEDWCDDLIPKEDAESIQYSAKLRIIMSIINETVKNGEKVLVFAHQLPELDLVEHYLETYGTTDFPYWVRNQHFYRIDGEVSPTIRNELCNSFNLDLDVTVFLISHLVGGLGLNLTAASRVILIASNHNPSTDTQSIYRIYRFGQIKKCYVYRVLSIGAMEEKIYHRCVAKSAVAGTVVDKYHFDRRYKCSDLRCMYEYDFEKYEERPIPLVPSDKLLAKLLQNTSDIYKYHEHSALLENRPEEELNDEDKNLAWDEFKREEKGEEAVRNLALPPMNPSQAPHTLQIRPQIQSRPPMYNRPQIPKRPINQPSTSNGVHYYYPLGPRFVGPKMVANPMNTNVRGLMQRGNNFHQQNPGPSGVRVNVPQTSGYQVNNSSIYRPQYNGYNRDIPSKPPSRPSNSSFNVLEDRQKTSYQQNAIPVSNQNMLNKFRLVHKNTTLPRQWNEAQEVVDLVDEEPPAPFSRGEFNYALNRIV